MLPQSRCQRRVGPKCGPLDPPEPQKVLHNGRLAPDTRMAIVGSPNYFQRFGWPRTPRDLTRHRCVNMRITTHGNLLPWEFEKAGREVNVHVEGQFTANTLALNLRCALDGMGLGYFPDTVTAPHVASGALVRVLEDWCEPFPGYHLYYPSRRQHSAAFRLLVDALRCRE